MKINKNIRQLLLVTLLIAILHITGWSTEVVAFSQKMVLKTGVTSVKEKETKEQANLNLMLEALDGSQIDLNQYKGKAIFINFWASWCAPCVAEMSDINSLYNATKEENVAFVLISLDRDQQKARKFIDRKEFDFPVYFPKSSIPKTFKTRSIPATYLINTKGEVVVEKIGMANYNTKKFKKLLLESAQ